MSQQSDAITRHIAEALNAVLNADAESLALAAKQLNKLDGKYSDPIQPFVEQAIRMCSHMALLRR